MYRHIMWDFDGTLLDTYPAMAQGLRQALAARGHDEPLDAILGEIKVTLGDAVKTYSHKYGVGEDFWQAECVPHVRRLEETLARPYPAIPGLLRAIVDAGGYNYVVTHRGDSAARYLAAFGLRDCFREIVSGENGFPLKPDPTGVRYLLGKYSIDPAEAVIIGDRSLDVEAGKNAGIAGIFFDEDGRTACTVADAVVHDLDALYDVLGVPREEA